MKSICIMKGDESKGNFTVPSCPLLKCRPKRRKERGWRVMHALTSLLQRAFLKLWARLRFCLFVCLFLTAIRKTKKTLYLSAGHTYNISVSHIDFSNTQLRRRTSKYAKPPENKWHNSSHQHKNSPAVSFNQFSHLSTYSSSHFSLHPPISPSTPLQSLQSAVSYRIPLQPSDAALQKKQRCTSVCSTLGTSTCAIQCKWETSIYFLLCTAKVLSRHTTLMSPDNIYGVLCASWVFAFFLDLAHAVSDLSFG